MSNNNGALSGVKVVTCSTAQAGTVPYMLMADLGAEVIKIEVPGTGDNSRRAGEMKGELSSFFETNNRGVKSLTLNLKLPEAREILHKLVKKADIFGQNFRPGAAERYGSNTSQLNEIWDFRESKNFDEKEKVAFEFAIAASSIPNRVGDKISNELRKHWDDG